MPGLTRQTDGDGLGMSMTDSKTDYVPIADRPPTQVHGYGDRLIEVSAQVSDVFWLALAT